MDIEYAVIDHYSGDDLAARILDALGNPADVSAADLAPFDELHVGGRRGTAYLTGKLAVMAGMKLLDVGCGLGGAARYMADVADADVTGIDLTPAYIAAAIRLSEAAGLAARTHFVCGGATSTGFADGAFDGAYTIHASMNIGDKAGLYREIARVVKNAGCFGLYDILAGPGGGPLVYPTPWTASADTSFLAGVMETEDLLRQAGFSILSSESRRDFALQSLQKMMEAPFLPGPQLIMGEDYREKIANLHDNIVQNLCAPWLMICRRT